MTERVRNMAVGITVILALCGLGGMIILFGEVPSFARSGYKLKILLPASGGVVSGSEIRLNGIHVGSAVGIKLMEAPNVEVAVDCRIDRRYRIPTNVTTSVGTRGFGGSAFIDLYSSGQASEGYLPTDGTAVLEGKITPYGGLLGSETSAELSKIAESFQSFSRLADNLNSVLMGQPPPKPAATGPASASAPATGAAPASAPATAPENQGLAAAINKFNTMLDGLNAIFNNQQNQENIQVSLANLRATTDKASKIVDDVQAFAKEARETMANVNATTSETGKHVNELTDRLGDDAARLGRLLTTLNEATEKIAHGEGTAGKLISDPQLYNDLVDSMRQLSKTMIELQGTLKTWREKGVDVKVF